MLSRPRIVSLSLCGLLTVAAGCGSVHEPTVVAQRVVVDDLPTGVYAVSSGPADAPTAGRYYAAADGSRLLVLDQSNGQANALYRRHAGGAWRAVPAVAGNLPVRLRRSDPAPLSATEVSIADMAGKYVVQEASGVVGNFSVRADGAVVAGGSACKLSGKLSAGTLPNTLHLSLKTRACGTLPAASTGVLVLNDDDSPARFRLVADNGRQLVDLWAFAD